MIIISPIGAGANVPALFSEGYFSIGLNLICVIEELKTLSIIVQILYAIFWNYEIHLPAQI